MIRLFFSHYLEMIRGYFKGLIIKITNPKRYCYLTSLRGDYNLLNKTRLKLVTEIKSKLKENSIDYFVFISRIKTIGSIDRKDKYIFKLHKEGDHSDSLGIKIITKNKLACYKIL